MPAVRRPAVLALTTLSSSVVLAGALLTSGALSASAAPAPASGCADVEVMVSRGTTEASPIGSMQVLATAITKATTKTVSTWGNPYPATFSFSSSTPEGVTDLITHLKSQITACPAQQFVLIGYSQGAMVIGDALGGGSFTASAPISSAVGAHVAAVVLWGDPRFNSAEPFDAGTFKAGVNGSFARTTGSLKAYSSRILDYCLADDGVCQGNGSTNINAGHLAYPGSSTVITASSNFVTKVLGSAGTPAPAPAPTTPAPSPTTSSPSSPAPVPSATTPAPPVTTPAPKPSPPAKSWWDLILSWFKPHH